MYTGNLHTQAAIHCHWGQRHLHSELSSSLKSFKYLVMVSWLMGLLYLIWSEVFEMGDILLQWDSNLPENEQYMKQKMDEVL